MNTGAMEMGKSIQEWGHSPCKGPEAGRAWHIMGLKLQFSL